MKICLIVDDYLPASKKSAAKAMHDLAVEFTLQGHLVTVVTPNQRTKGRNDIFILDGVTVCEFDAGETKSASSSIRLVNETLFSPRAWLAFRSYFKNHQHDLIIYHSPSIFWGILVFYLKRLWMARSYLILRDLFPQWVIDQGMISSASPITFYLRVFESINYSSADFIGLQSPKNMAWFSAANLSSKPVEVLFNWAKTESIAIGADTYRTSLGLQNKVVFFYGGNIGPAQDMFNIVVLAKRMLGYKNAYFLLVGSGSEVGMIKKLVSEDQISNLLLLPPVDQDDYKKMLAEFDVGLFCLHRSHTTHNFPGKLLGYMNQAKPILGCVNPENDLKQLIESANAGYISISGESDDLFINAVKLLNDGELRCNIGRNGRRLLTDVFSVRKASEQILKRFI